ncbi:MAG: hypothetical protein HY077_10200 [Elusimicrobia bacterium]|nr:hypothetical protein [Elusimicrobiota bacterium]
MAIVESSLERRRRAPRLVEEPGASEGAAVQDVRLDELYLPCPHCRTLGADKAVECRVCGLIFAKWRARRVLEPALPAAAAPVRRLTISAWVWLASGALGLLLALAPGLPSIPPMEIKQADFAEKVLQVSTPVLVMFDVARQCGCAEDELISLRGQWKGSVAVVTMNAVDSPALGAQYGVEKDAIVLLFDHGRLVKRANAREMEDRGDMKKQLEDFVRQA